MTLREELARRLAGMQWRGIGDDGRTVANVEIDAAQGPGTTWGDLADECIRQMEWARKPRLHTHPSGTIYEEYNPPLTLAPPDWKP